MDDALFHGDLVNTSRIIYTPSDFAKSSLLYIQEIGSLQAAKPHTSRRDYLASYLFFFVSSGSGKLLYEGVEYQLKEGSFVYIDTRKPYSHKTSDDLWSLSWIHFDGPLAENIYKKYKERGGLPVFVPSNFSSYLSEFKNLYEIASSSSYTRDMEINAGLSKLLTYLMMDSWHPNHNDIDNKKNHLYDLKAYLEGNYEKKISLEELAERYNMNKCYLTRVFKKQYGISIMDYLLSIRINQAKNLLRFTDLSAEEVGQKCGIGDVYYFSRVFKKVEGISAREYKKQWR